MTCEKTAGNIYAENVYSIEINREYVHFRTGVNAETLIFMY